ncbi:unnamed protein product [Clonostachys rosea f. rosea IK726]|uniref:SGF29 C-terminal domain-containing protein n=2 Tax=Bionectria ochroleuca TaxID=29856 RepID=A0A0B7K3I1_BIOOC|nr:unnamed protein product [Clonostachys rosea f. rosea IK726]
MSSRNRSGRGSNRNNGNNANSDHGEEAQLWESIKARVSEVVVGVNAESKGLSKLVEMDKEMGSMDSEKIPGASLKEMEQLCRAGVRQSDDNILKARELVDQLKILRAVCVAKEQAEAAVAGPSKRSSARDNAASAAALSKVVFSKGESVAFKPKTVSGEAASDWILGEVAQVLGEGKSRRYKVIDVEPEEQSKQKEYRTSASSMIPITPESQAATLGPWEPKTTVLALYPNTTTFYRAEVHSMDEDGRVNLKFEGENDSSTLQQVERRFVIEYRP